MHVLVTKDGATKVAREVRDLDEARQIQQAGFVVELISEDGSVGPLPEAASHSFEVFWNKGQDVVAKAKAASTKKAHAKKAPTAKKSSAKKRGR